MAAFDGQRFDDFTFERMKETWLPSLTAALIRDGKVVHLRAFGRRDIASAQAATPSTLYGIGSITKPLVAIAIAKLVEAGRIDFHDPVTKVLPSLPKAFEGVEIHHLLSHTSGIPGLGYAEVLVYGTIGEYHTSLPIASLKDMEAFLGEVEGWVESKPGEKLFYLNEGYYLLGEVVSKVSRLPFERYLKEEVFQPLGMGRTFFSKKEIEGDPNRATPYLIRDKKATPSLFAYGSGAAGGVVSNVLDLSNMVKMFIGRGEFEGKQILDRRSIELMETSYASWPVVRYGGDGYGYGLQVIPDFRGHRVFGHGGSVEVYTSDFHYSPDGDVGVALLANGTGYNMGTLGMYALSLLLGEDPEESLPQLGTEMVLKRLAGNYRSYRDTLYARVKVNGSFLTLSGDDIGDGIVLVPEKLDSEEPAFFTLYGGTKVGVKFRFNAHGVELLFERYRYRRVGPL